MDPEVLREIREAIRTIPDYPRPGVMFRDITTLLGNARVFQRVVPGATSRSIMSRASRRAVSFSAGRSLIS